MSQPALVSPYPILVAGPIVELGRPEEHGMDMD